MYTHSSSKIKQVWVHERIQVYLMFHFIWIFSFYFIIIFDLDLVLFATQSLKLQPRLKRFKINFFLTVTGFSQLADVSPYGFEHRFRGWRSHDRANQPFEFRFRQC